MALTAYVQWRVGKDTGVAEVNGGGFDPSLTTNMLTDGAATSATGTAPVFTSASYSFVAGDVGAIIYIASGTNWTPGWYPIASVNAGAATLTASVDSLRGGALLANNTPLTASGCATTASPTGATWSIDYSALAAPFLAITDLDSTASTTVHSTAGGFHAAMVGNILRLASGTGTPTAGYYAITGFTDANNLVVDRASGTYTAGVAKIGGSHAGLINYASTGGGGLSAPAVATPLAAGHIVKIRGAGSENPSTVDYDTSAGYYTFPNGTVTGRISFLGINGRPLIGYSGILFYNQTYGRYHKLAAKQTAATYLTTGLVNSGKYAVVTDCIFDQNGNDSVQLKAGAFNCLFKNSGATTAGTAYVQIIDSSYCMVYGNVYENIRGGAISSNNSISIIQNNIIRACKGTSSMASILLADSSEGTDIIGNTIDGGAGDGIRITTTAAICNSTIMNNIISNHAGAGKYGINCTVGSTAQNDNTIAGIWDYNNLYGNTAARNNCSAGLHDIALDPQYTNTGTGDYSIGTNMKAVGFPNLFPG